MFHFQNKKRLSREKMSWILLLVFLPLIRCQTEEKLLSMCKGVSFKEKFNPYLGIGQFYQLATYTNEKELDINYDCPREIWEVAQNGTVYFNRQIIRLEKNKKPYLEFQTLDLAIPMTSHSANSGDFIWKAEGMNSPTTGRFSYRYETWDKRKYCFVYGCQVTGRLDLFVLSRSQSPISPLHHRRILQRFGLRKFHHFSFKNCVSVRPLACGGDTVNGLSGRSLETEAEL